MCGCMAVLWGMARGSQLAPALPALCAGGGEAVALLPRALGGGGMSMATDGPWAARAGGRPAHSMALDGLWGPFLSKPCSADSLAAGSRWQPRVGAARSPECRMAALC